MNSFTTRRLRDLVKGGMRRVFEGGQRMGVDILPRHFYSSIPDIRNLKRTRDWRQPGEMAGVAGADIGSQLEFVKSCCPEEVRRCVAANEVYERACAQNGEAGYGPCEAAFLHAFVFSRRPKRVVQVGAGVSTAVILEAAREAGYEVDVSCVDPYPTEFLRHASEAGRLRLIPEPAQRVQRCTFTDLRDGDLLFIDSTHTVKPGSEVNRIILDVLPRMCAGTYVHFHDIYFPYDYPRNVLTQNFFWVESSLLHAFLIHNSRYAIAASLSMLHYAVPERLKELLPCYLPAPNDDGLEVGAGEVGLFPSSIYLRRTDEG